MKKEIRLVFLGICSMLMVSGCKKTPADCAYKVMGEYSTEAKEKYNWDLMALGGRFGDAIKEVDLKFIVYDEVDIIEARRLLVKGVQGLLTKMNQDKSAATFLSPSLAYNQLDFGICFFKKPRGFVSGKNIALASLINGKVRYNIDKPIGFEEVHKETYEEALEIVKREVDVIIDICN